MSRPLRSLSRSAGIWVVVAGGFLFGACSKTTTRTTDSGSMGGSGSTPAVATTLPGYDAAAEMSTATKLRDDLVDAGIACAGKAKPPPKADDADLETGVVVGLDCTVDEVAIGIGVYQTEAAKQAGIENLSLFACAMKLDHTDYVDGGTWVIGAQPVGQNESDVAMTERIAAAVHAPIRELPCS